MNNFEKYSAIHAEVMNKLESGEITAEQAKEIKDLAFDKYVVEFVEEDDDELEIFEESARQKYRELLEKKKTRLENYIKHSTGETRKKYQEELDDVLEKLYQYGTGAVKGGYKNKDATNYIKRTDDGKILEGKITGMGRGGSSYTWSHPTTTRNSEYQSVGGGTSNDQFSKDLGSKEPNKSELHDNINSNTKEKDKK
jgi:mevalonate kinase